MEEAAAQSDQVGGRSCGQVSIKQRSRGIGGEEDIHRVVLVSPCMFVRHFGQIRLSIPLTETCYRVGLKDGLRPDACGARKSSLFAAEAGKISPLLQGCDKIRMAHGSDDRQGSQWKNQPAESDVWGQTPGRWCNGPSPRASVPAVSVGRAPRTENCQKRGEVCARPVIPPLFQGFQALSGLASQR